MKAIKFLVAAMAMAFAMNANAEWKLDLGDGHFTVNGKRVDIPSYLVKPGEEIAICEKSRNSAVFTELTGENAPVVLIPKWLEKAEVYSGKVVAMPEREDVDFPVEEHLIVELYSK